MCQKTKQVPDISMVKGSSLDLSFSFKRDFCVILLFSIDLVFDSRFSYFFLFENKNVLRCFDQTRNRMSKKRASLGPIWKRVTVGGGGYPGFLLNIDLLDFVKQLLGYLRLPLI